jgi:alkylated DNA repair dioxygenase AlkB
MERQVPEGAEDVERWALGDGGWVLHAPGFVASHGEDHQALMERLLASLPLRQETVHVAGRSHPTPRLTSWHGDPGCAYAYSGRVFEPEPWTEELARLRDRLTPLCGVRFNSVLANYYRDGADSMGAHSDDEAELGPSRDDVRIGSVSLGAPRRFVIKHRATGETREWPLGGGSLLLMGGTMQRFYRHRVPKTKRPVGPRLNLTFRLVREGAVRRRRP